MSALAEEEGADGGHGAVADDCDAFGHAGMLRLPIAQSKSPVPTVSSF
jgi:hypothetical protein